MKWTAIIGVSLLWMAAQTQEMRPRVAQLMNVRGTVILERGGKVITAKARTLQPVQAGDTLTLAAGAQAQVLYISGGRFALEPKSKVRINPATVQSLTGTRPHSLTAVSTRLASAEPLINSMERSRLGGEIFRGGEEKGPRNPLPFGAVTEAAITLKWEDCAEPLQLTIADVETGKTLIERKLPRRSRRYELTTEDMTALETGRWYFWKVVAEESKRECGALLRRAPAAEAEELKTIAANADKERRKAPNDATPDLLLAVQYERLGYFEKAALAYEAALAKSPKDEGIIAALKRLTLP